jgi:hypothetical protein
MTGIMPNQLLFKHKEAPRAAFSLFFNTAASFLTQQPLFNTAACFLTQQSAFHRAGNLVHQ